MAPSTAPITRDEVVEAHDRIREHIFLSPCLHSSLLSEQLGCQVFLKLDNMQATGSFKERGAANKLATLSPEERDRGVIAASAGNHAQAVAYHGARLGIRTTIVMPEGTPLVKVSRTRSFGGEVVLAGSNFDAAYERAREIQSEKGHTFVHPFDDRAIIAGQGSVGLEIMEQVPDIDAIVVAVGGGGLAAGMLAAVKPSNPDVQIIGVEPEVLPSMKTALQNNALIELPEAQTLADGISVRRVGQLTFELLQNQIDDMVTVSEAEIARAILVLLEQEKTLAEGAGAAALAALMADRIRLPGKKVCVVICGGNIDVNVISRIIERGLVATGRLCRFSLRMTDTPGTLAGVLATLGELRGNVLEIHHNRTFESGDQFGTTNVSITLETRGPDHIDRIRETLRSQGVTVLDI